MKKPLLTFLLLAAAAHADTVTTPDGKLEGVYVSESSTRYYVADPDSGNVHSYSKEEAAVTFSGDRKALLARWRELNPLEEPKKLRPSEEDERNRAVYRKPRTIVTHGAARRNDPVQNAFAYREYISSGYRPGMDQRKKRMLIYAPSMEAAKVRDLLTPRPAQRLGFSFTYIVRGRGLFNGLSRCVPRQSFVFVSSGFLRKIDEKSVEAEVQTSSCATSDS